MLLIPCYGHPKHVTNEHATSEWYVGDHEGGMFLCNQCLAEYLHFIVGIPPMECLRRHIDCIEAWG